MASAPRPDFDLKAQIKSATCLGYLFKNAKKTLCEENLLFYMFAMASKSYEGGDVGELEWVQNIDLDALYKECMQKKDAMRSLGMNDFAFGAEETKGAGAGGAGEADAQQVKKSFEELVTADPELGKSQLALQLVMFFSAHAPEKLQYVGMITRAFKEKHLDILVPLYKKNNIELPPEIDPDMCTAAASFASDEDVDKTLEAADALAKAQEELRAEEAKLASFTSDQVKAWRAAFNKEEGTNLTNITKFIWDAFISNASADYQICLDDATYRAQELAVTEAITRAITGGDEQEASVGAEGSAGSEHKATLWDPSIAAVWKTLIHHFDKGTAWDSSVEVSDYFRDIAQPSMFEGKAADLQAHLPALVPFKQGDDLKKPVAYDFSIDGAFGPNGATLANIMNDRYACQAYLASLPSGGASGAGGADFVQHMHLFLLMTDRFADVIRKNQQLQNNEKQIALQSKAAWEIYRAFLTPKSPYKLPISTPPRQRIEFELAQPNAGTFLEVHEALLDAARTMHWDKMFQEARISQDMDQTSKWAAALNAGRIKTWKERVKLTKKLSAGGKGGEDDSGSCIIS